MVRKIFLALFIGCSSFAYMAGQNIKAKIVGDVDSQFLPNATIKILTPDSTLSNTYVSDEKGLFNAKVELDNFNILISYIGYLDAHLSIKNEDKKDLDLGSIIMHSDNILDEITVSAQSVVEEMNKTIAFPTVRQQKASTSGIDLLQQLQLPGLFVDPVLQNVQISGKSGVIYRINGVNSSLKEIITLKASQIQRVEYSQNPTIRDLDSNMGVINVILKKENTGTYIYADGLGAATTGFINGFASIRTIFDKSQLSLDYNVNWRDYTERWSFENESYYFPNNDTLSFDKSGRNAPFGYLSQNINLSYIFNDTKNIFVFKFLNSLYDSSDKNYIDVFQSSSQTPLFFRDIHSKFKNYTPSVDLYYTRKIDEGKGVEVNLVGTLMNSDYNRTLVDTYTNEDYSVYNTTDGNRKSLIFESLYYNKKHPVNYNLGVKASYNHTRNEYNVSDISKITQFNVYPYISIEGKIKNLFYTLGTGLQIFHTEDDLQSKNYYKNLSTLSLFYKKGSWSIRNVTQYTPSFPFLSYLNDVDQRQDSLMVIRGNATLKPAQKISNNLYLAYQVKENISTNLTLNASKFFDPIRNNYYYDSSIKSFITQRNNQKYESQFGAAFDVNFSSILKIFNIGSGVAWNNYQSKGDNYAYELNNFYWYVFCNAQIKNFSIDGGYRKASKDLAGQTVYLNENYSSVGASYKKNNLTISMGCMFPFTSGTKYGAELNSSVISSNKNIYIRDNANMFYARVAYSISWGKSMFGINKNINNSDWDNGIIKVQDN